MSNVYSFKDYDKHLCLKPPAEFWLTVAFFLRPFILKMSSFQMGRGGSKTKDVSLLYDIAYPDNFSFFLAVLSTLPIVLLLIAFAKRKPDASDLMQKLWRNGVTLLVVAAILNILVVFLSIVLGKAHSVHLFGWIQLGIIVLIFAYLFKSQRLRDTFADYPVAAEDNKKKGEKT
jgi:membrane associated rhomboid family serine protease